MTLVGGVAAVAAAQTDSPAVDKALETLKTYDWGSDREALKPIDQAIIATQGDAAARKALEKSLVDALASGISRSAQDYVCRKLRVMGTTPVHRGPRRSSAGRGDLAHRKIRLGTHS
jgi:hypothetical protein